MKTICTNAYNHLCFQDTKTGGLFCGDALGTYYPEVKTFSPLCVQGVDPYIVLQSIKKLQEFNPSILFFSHGGATAEVAIHHIESVTQRCLDTALKKLKAGENHKVIAKSLIEIFIADTIATKVELKDWPYTIPLLVEGYRYYFKKKGVI